MNNTTDDNTTVDLNELIVAFVKRFPFPNDVKKHLDLDCITKDDIDDKDLLIDQISCEYVKRKKMAAESPLPNVSGSKTKPMGNVVYSCEFKNKTSREQENEFTANKETKSRTHVSFQKSLVKEGSFSLSLSPPTTMLQASAAFKQSLAVNKNREITTEETMAWSARSKIIIPPRKKITASLIIDEKDESYDFNITTKISGTIKIFLKNKQNGWKLAYPLEINDLTAIFPTNKGFVQNPDKSVTFVSKGRTNSRFGVSQKVSLVESDLGPED